MIPDGELMHYSVATDQVILGRRMWATVLRSDGGGDPVTFSMPTGATEGEIIRAGREAFAAAQPDPGLVSDDDDEPPVELDGYEPLIVRLTNGEWVRPAAVVAVSRGRNDRTDGQPDVARSIVHLASGTTIAAVGTTDEVVAQLWPGAL